MPIYAVMYFLFPRTGLCLLSWVTRGDSLVHGFPLSISCYSTVHFLSRQWRGGEEREYAWEAEGTTVGARRASRCLFSGRSRLISITRRNRRPSLKKEDMQQLQAKTALWEVLGRWQTNVLARTHYGSWPSPNLSGLNAEWTWSAGGQ